MEQMPALNHMLDEPHVELKRPDDRNVQPGSLHSFRSRMAALYKPRIKTQCNENTGCGRSMGPQFP